MLIHPSKNYKQVEVDIERIPKCNAHAPRFVPGIYCRCQTCRDHRHADAMGFAVWDCYCRQCSFHRPAPVDEPGEGENRWDPLVNFDIDAAVDRWINGVDRGPQNDD